MDISVLTQCFGENGMPDECSLKSNLIEIKEKLESKEVTWEMFILALGELLKSTNITSRKKGVIILCKFINLQSLSSVTDEELSFLIEFLLRRLKDHHSFVPVIVESLLFLLRTFKIDDKQALTIFDTINKESFTQQLNIDERFQVYTLIAHLFNDHKEAFRSINNDFLYGFIQIIEGERDPRCLVLSFKLFQQVITHLELGHLDEEAFEVISCYFPILYNPVKQTSPQISRNDLHQELKKCFKSASAFGPYAMHLFMEKLESEVESAKIDVYDFLIDCAKIYGSNCLQPFLPQLWTSIRIDLLQNSSSKLSESAIQALSAILSTIEVDKEIGMNLVKDILKDLEISLTHLELNLTRPASSCLAAISVVSCFYFETITEAVFPIILKHWVFDIKKDNRQFIEELSIFFENWHKHDIKLHEKHFSCQESILMQLTSSLQSDDYSNKLASLDCVSHLLKCSILWDSNNLENLAKSILHTIIGDDFDEKITFRIKNVLKNFTDHHLDVANQQITNYLLEKLPDAKNVSPCDNNEKIIRYLSLLQGCKIGEKHLINLITNLMDYNEANISTDALSVYECLVELVKETVDQSNQHIVDEMLLQTLLEKILVKSENLTKMEDGLLPIFSKLMYYLPLNRKSKLVDQISEYLSDSYMKSISAQQRHKTGLILSKLLCSMSLDFEYSWEDLQSKISQLFTSFEANELDCLFRIIEILVNKSPLVNSQESIQQLIHLSDSCHQTDPLKSVKLLLSINTGTVIRGAEISSLVTNKLLEIIKNHQSQAVAKHAAAFFVPFLQDYPYLTEKHGGQVLDSYSKKYFDETYQILMDQVNNCSDWRKNLFALCLLNHLKNLPLSIVKHEIIKFESVIILYINSDTPCDHLITALDCLNILIELKSSLLLANLSTIIGKLLEMAQTNSHLKIRQKSLDCLSILTDHLSDVQLMPHRSKTLNQVKLALDDKKRLVRNSAAKALNKWLLLGQLN